MILLILALLGDDCCPLKEGLTWTYRTDSGGEAVTRVTGREKVGDIECFVIETEAGKTKTRVWQAVDTEGLRLHQVETGGRVRKLEKPILVWKASPKKGDSWQAEGTVDLIAVTETYTNQGEEEVSIGETKHKAWRIHRVIKSDGKVVGESDAWYSKDVGVVKRTHKIAFGDAVQETTLELVKFEKKK